jgi:hypothetical protein
VDTVVEKVVGAVSTVTPRKVLADVVSRNSVARLATRLPSEMAVSGAVIETVIVTEPATTATVTSDAATPVLVATACAMAAFSVSP